MAQNFTDVYNRLLLRAQVGPALAQDLIRDAFNQLCERREWSWLVRQSSFFPRVFDQTGKVNLIGESATVTATGANFLASYVGCQFRAMGNPSAYSTYTIIQVPDPTTLVLDRRWSGPTAVNQPFQIFQCYFSVPEDFQYFYSIISPTNNYRLHHNVQQAELDMVDAQRVQTGDSYCAAFYDNARVFSGSLDLQKVLGAGPEPVATTSYGYSYPAPLTYVIWIQQGGTPSSGLLNVAWFIPGEQPPPHSFTVIDSAPYTLSNGVQIYFPEANYVTDDRFVINAIPDSTASVPRYELWPRPVNSPREYPYLYISKVPELSDQNPTLPPTIAARTDVLLEMGLANCARIPGTTTDANPYFNPTVALQHDARAERMIFELETKDDSIALKDLRYLNLNWAPTPWLGGNWLQSHAIYPYS